MIWNWQQPNWPEWHFNADALKTQEKQFLLQSGQLMGVWQHLNNKDQMQLKIDLLSDEAIQTSAIEGEYLDRDSVRSFLYKQFGMMSDRRASPAESGIAALMVDCFENVGKRLNHNTLGDWHRLVCRGRDDLAVIGGYRQHSEPMQVFSGAVHKPKVHFEAPPSDQVQAEMAHFMDWFADTDMSALAKSGLTHLWFVSIHPFEDGNDRIARALSEKALAESLGQPSLVALSQTIAKERKAYYTQLESNNKTMDITDWLVWFADMVLKAQQHSLDMIHHLISKTKILDRLRGKLNPRQEKVLIRMFEAGPEGFIGGLSAKNYISLTHTTPATARRDLSDLVIKGALTRTGERKGTRYWLNLEA